MATPFTILTGFLGAGKTTVLNRMLSRPGGRRIAVLVNELGRISIDGRLVERQGGDVLELAGGCVCCKVGDDLWDGVADVIARSKPDHVVLETTGIAEPDAIVQGFARLPPEQQGLVRVAGVVCIVDGQAGVPQIERREEARLQVEAADRIMLSKLDIASAVDVGDLHDALETINPRAERVSFPLGDAGTHSMVPWLLDIRAQDVAGRRRRPHRHNDGQVVAASLGSTAPLIAAQLETMVHELAEQLLRVKGFVNVAGESRRGFLELAGGRVELRYGEPWPEGERRTELVMIGEGLDEATLQRRLWACRAGGDAEVDADDVPF